MASERPRAVRLTHLSLTEDQKKAAASTAGRLFIEASPGSGKTTVAAERFGIARFDPRHASSGPVVAVSFTRSATSELRRRVLRRWGPAATAWPHRIETIDSFMRRVLEFLLRDGSLGWPGGHTELEILDDWHGHAGFRPLDVNGWCRVMDVRDDGTIRTRAVRLGAPRWGFSNVGPIRDLLKSGLATPREVRETLAEAFASPEIRDKTRSFLRGSAGHLIVDEVFDANVLDLRLFHACCQADVHVTFIGDPWQALYGWRGATPDQVEPFMDDKAFVRRELPHSFRFTTEQTQLLAHQLRTGEPAALPGAVQVEVALGRKWAALWALDANVLPLSFGRPRNQTDAAMALLLDVATRALLRSPALFVREAVLILGIGVDRFEQEGAARLGPVLELLGAEGSAAALDALRDAVVELGAAQRPPAVVANEAGHCANLDALAMRLVQEATVPGLTVFQAKGLEWNSVGVHLTPQDGAHLAGGLDAEVDDHRVLYVALTRARRNVGAL